MALARPQLSRGLLTPLSARHKLAVAVAGLSTCLLAILTGHSWAIVALYVSYAAIVAPTLKQCRCVLPLLAAQATPLLELAAAHSLLWSASWALLGAVTSLGFSLLLAVSLGRRRPRPGCLCAASILGVEEYATRLVGWLGLCKLSRLAGVRKPCVEVEVAAVKAALAAYTVAALAAPLLGPLAAVAYLAPLLLLRLYYMLLAGERARRGEEELPFLALWAWLLERSGAGTLGDAIRYAETSGLLPGLASTLRVEEEANTHPSQRVRRFYSYYLAIASSGGDVVGFLESIVSREIDSIRDAMILYSEKAGSIATIGLGIVALTGIASLLAAITSGSGRALLLALWASAIAAAATILALAAVQPKHYNPQPAGKQAVLAAALAGLAAAVAAGPAAGAVAALLVHGAHYVYVSAKSSREEEEAASMLRIAIEALRSTPDRPLSQILLEAARAAGGTAYRRVREALAGRIEGAWITRYTLYTLVEISARNGVADPLPLEKLYDLATSHIHQRRFTGSRLRILAGLALGYPPLLVAAAHALPTNTSQPLATLLTPPSPEQVMLLAAVQAALMGAITAKAAASTLKATHYPAAAIASVLLANKLTPLLL